MPKSLRTKLWVSRLLYTLFFLVLPLLFINHTYQIFSVYTKTSVKITAGIIMAIIIFAFFLKKYIKKFIDSLAPGSFRIVMHALYKSLVLIIIWIFIIMSKESIDVFLKCFGYVTISIVIANVIEGFEEVYEQQINEIKLMQRQDEYRRKYNL